MGHDYEESDDDLDQIYKIIMRDQDWVNLTIDRRMHGTAKVPIHQIQERNWNTSIIDYMRYPCYTVYHWR